MSTFVGHKISALERNMMKGLFVKRIKDDPVGDGENENLNSKRNNPMMDRETTQHLYSARGGQVSKRFSEKNVSYMEENGPMES